MSVTRVGVVLLISLVVSHCRSISPSYRIYRKRINKESSYNFQKHRNKDDYFVKSFHPKSSSEESFERLPYFYPVPSSLPFSYEVSSREINEIDDAEETASDKEEIFSYDHCDPYGPSNWGKINENCDGSYQSPVNLHTFIAQPYRESQPLIIDGFDDVPSTVIATNDGHSATFRFKFWNEKPVRLFGGPLKAAYNLDNIHFHWGENDRAGSEHLLNSRRYSAEVHFVTYNSKYATLKEASTHRNGLAVLAFFYELDNIRATSNPFIDLLPEIVEAGSSYEESRNVFSIADLIKQKKFRYVSYKGSLTTPDCLETVTWIVATKPLKISSRELAEFRKLKDNEGKYLRKNFRPLQKFNDRSLFSY